MPHADRALGRAREHCYLAGVGDVGEALCGANMPYGIAKIQQWSGDFAVLDIKSNACGMIVVELDDPPPADEITARAGIALRLGDPVVKTAIRWILRV